MVIMEEARLDDGVTEGLIALSRDWEAENSCYGYRANDRADLEGRRVFLAKDGRRVVGYLFGVGERAAGMRSIMPDGTPFFEMEELYVVPSERGRGVGSALFRHVEAALRGEAEYILLSTATKNWRAILHFYLEELGMEFWNARLFKRVPTAAPDEGPGKEETICIR